MPDGNEEQGSGEQGGETPTWETVLAELPEAARALYTEHTQGLRGALKTERGQRQDLTGQLRDATAKLEDGSETRKTLEKMTGQLELAEQRAAFAEEAVGIGVRNIRLAWLMAQDGELFDQRGNANWTALKRAAPELFGPERAPAGNAGAGTGGEPGDGASMNRFIRRQAGRE